MFFMRKLITLLTMLFLIPLASAQFEITHPNLNITNYQNTLTQSQGTTQAYSVIVMNTGDVRLDKVYLSLSFLPSSWYEIVDSKPLDVGESGTFAYTIKLPHDTVGKLDLDLTAHGMKGFGEVTKTSVKVKLEAGISQPTQSTSVPETTSATTTGTSSTMTSIPAETDFLSKNSSYIVIILTVVIAVALAVLFKL